MLGRLFTGFKKEETQSEEDALPRALAALLVEAARADENYTVEEKAMIDRVLLTKFALTKEDAEALRLKAEEDQAEANDLYRFSSVVKDALDQNGKRQLIEDMWAVALTDDERDPHEEQVIRRLVGLLHLEDTESTAARRRAEERRGAA